MSRLQILSVSLISAAALLVGCSSPDSDAPTSSTATPAGSSSSTPTDVAKYGDMVPLQQVTDDIGTYESTTIDPADPAMKYNSKVVDDTALEAGYTEDEILAGQQFVVKFVSQEGIDSIAVDGGLDGWEEWKKTVAPEYLNATAADALLKSAGVYDRGLVIVNDPDDLIPNLIRDGRPRIKESKTVLQSVTGGTDETYGMFLWIRGLSTTKYRVSDEEAQKFLLAASDPISLESIEKQRPELFDGAENVELATFHWAYAINQVDGDWKILGLQNSLSTNLQDK